ncbi:MAG: DUF3299 domain-containing protein [Pirellulaceae bacterium]
MSAATNLTAVELSYPLQDPAELQPYRAVSRSAVISAALGGASILALVFPTLLLLPLLALVLGLVALVSIRRYPSEYTGTALALVGIALGIAMFFGGAARHTYVYVTEVPEGYVRTAFGELQPDPDYPELYPVSPKAMELAGKQVFIKGYMHPGVASSGKVNRFILVPDMGTCCFGGDPKTTDMIEVYVPNADARIAYSRTQIKLAGDFAVGQTSGPTLEMKNPVLYHLKVDQVR